MSEIIETILYRLVSQTCSESDTRVDKVVSYQWVSSLATLPILRSKQKTAETALRYRWETLTIIK